MTDKLQEGIKLYHIRNYHDALKTLLALHSDSPQTSAEIAYYSALCFTQLEKFEDALTYYEQVVTSCDDIQRVHQCRLILAVLYTQTGRIRLADFELRKLLETGCQTANVFCTMAYSAWTQKDLDKAIKLYEKALSIDANHATALNGLGYVLISAGQEITKAFSLIKKALEQQPNSPAYLDSLGWAYHKLGLTKEAHQFVKRARNALPGNKEIEDHFSQINKQLASNREEKSLSKLENR
ncbi:MAG: tetratricopeptide repeat protein [Treponemataceae bacterium]